MEKDIFLRKMNEKIFFNLTTVGMYVIPLLMSGPNVGSEFVIDFLIGNDDGDNLTPCINLTLTIKRVFTKKTFNRLKFPSNCMKINHAC